MTPQDLALRLEEELEEVLDDLDRPHRLRVRNVRPPDVLDAETCFIVTVSSEGSDDTEIVLPTSLAVGYLADEEAAVDEWRLWVHDIIARFEA